MRSSLARVNESSAPSLAFNNASYPPAIKPCTNDGSTP
ncbi:hypothetical protein CNEONATNEC26_02324 [Clostridium neonatale]|nr:hypothetical protein CNEONATNEC26_02324 [Clostridium neonatale]